jgi:predicted transcriptional regulator
LRHRPRLLIYVEILSELRDRPSGPTRMSRVANLSYDTCVEILKELEAKGLVRREAKEGHDVFSTTPAGFQVVDDWTRVWERLRP